MNLHRFGLAAILTLATLASSAHAQLVVVQPGYVKAPFVRVYTYPDGSSYVRAPFVGVYSPPKIHHHIAPTPEELAELDEWMLRRVARDAAARLDSTLQHFPTGDVWRRHFQTRELGEIQAQHGESVPTEDDQARFAEVLKIYDAGAESADLRDVARLTDYQVLHGTLRELALPAKTRLRRQLATSAAFLDRTLEHFRTGDTWQRYLAMPEGVVTENAEQGDELDTAALIKLRERFDEVNQNETYRGIARLPDFKVTRQRLARYLELAMNDTPKPSAESEELPPPSREE